VSVWKMAIVVAGGALVLSLAGCGGGGGEGEDNCTPKGAGTGTAAQTVKVVADPNTVGTYDPKSVSVKAGESVEWDFQDQGAQHSVTSDDNTTFDSCLLSAGGKFLATFSTAGDFKYHCTIHSQMVGDIKVS
jgi:plastocyanin